MAAAKKLEEPKQPKLALAVDPPKRGRKIKPCPKCHQLAGIKGGKCANTSCGYSYPETVRRVRKVSAAITSETIKDFILIAGGIKEAKDKINKVEFDATTEFVIKCGGVSEALAKIDIELERLGIK